MENHILINERYDVGVAAPKRGRLAVGFSVVFLIIVFGFFSIFCFFPGLMAIDLGSGVTAGIVMEQGLIIASILFSGLYVKCAGRYDKNDKDRARQNAHDRGQA